MIGGDRAYGMGGYNKTPVEEALPVHMEVRDKERRPDVALVFVVDKSGLDGRMPLQRSEPGPDELGRRGQSRYRQGSHPAGLGAATGRRQARRGGVRRCAGRWAVDIAQLPSLSKSSNAIAPVQPNGRTNVRGGLLAAKAALEKTDARVKHVILLTDGWSQSGNASDIADEMRAEGITISTVAAGSGSAPTI